MPGDWTGDSGRRAVAGIPEDLEFATKPQLGTEIVRELLTEGRCPPWVTGDEVYGRDARLRAFLEDQGSGYVLKIPCSFRVTLPAGHKMLNFTGPARTLAEYWNGRSWSIVRTP